MRTALDHADLDVVVATLAKRACEFVLLLAPPLVVSVSIEQEEWRHIAADVGGR
jgi:hypothetical protein